MNDHDKAKLYSDVLQKYLIAKAQITHTENLSQLVTQYTHSSLYSNESILETGYAGCGRGWIERREVMYAWETLERRGGEMVLMGGR